MPGRENAGLGKSFAEEGKHAVACDVRERCKFEGVVATVEFEGAGFGAVAAKRLKHFAREFGEHGGVVFSIDHETSAASTHAALDVGHGADGRPVVSEVLHTNVVAKAFPDVIGGHALADNVRVVGGNVKEAANADGGVVSERDIADGRAKAGAENAEFRVALLFEPAEAAARVLNRLAIRLQGEADVGAADLVGALVPASHAAIVVRQAHLERGDSKTSDPFAKAILAVPFRIPVWKDEHGGAFRRLERGTQIPGGPPQTCVNDVVFRPG